jgi:arylsulfatase A-like enzyme
MRRLLVLLLSLSSVALAQPDGPPNVVVILADDLGWGDLGAYGQDRIETPHLDRMAAEGTRFTQFYSGSPVCAPSRAVLMTGQHAGRVWVRNNVSWKPRGDLPLRDGDVTMAEVFRDAGYATGVFGKWALGLGDTSGAPHRQGFDAFFGFEDQSEAHRYHVSTLQALRGDVVVDVPIDSAAYAHDLIWDAALAWTETVGERPFFLYLPTPIPHAELVVPPSSLAAYLDDAGESVFPETPFPGGHYAAQPAPRATYAAMVSRLDRDVGRLLERLRRLDRPTVVVFTSDNGPHREGGGDPAFFESAGPHRGAKRDLYEGGIRVPLVVWSPGLVRAGVVHPHVWAAYDLLPTLAALADAPVPNGLDGLDMSGALTGSAPPPAHRFLYWELHDRDATLAQAVREGDWKAVRRTSADASTTELYHLGDDPAEADDLAARYPGLVARLGALMDRAHEPPQHPEFHYYTEGR